jgi:RND superfamily putative drug exporter
LFKIDLTFSFFLVFAVLFDTLVVRSMLVPCLMTLLGRYNWWPAGPVEAPGSRRRQGSIQDPKPPM